MGSGQRLKRFSRRAKAALFAPFALTIRQGLADFCNSFQRTERQPGLTGWNLRFTRVNADERTSKLGSDSLGRVPDRGKRCAGAKLNHREFHRVGIEMLEPSP